MAAFQRISGFKKISYCRRCKDKMINAKPSEIYCNPCVDRLKVPEAEA